MTREVSRDAIRAAMPELEWISDAGLRDKVVEAWATALAPSSFQRLEDVPGDPPKHADTLFWELVAKDRHCLRVADLVRMAMPADGLRPLPVRAREARS